MKKRLDQITKKEFDEGRVFIESAFGIFPVSGRNQEWWVYCPTANMGHGRSFFCHPGAKMLVADYPMGEVRE